MIAVVAKEFGVLPTQAARDLDRDPDRLSFECIGLLRYAEAKHEYDRASIEGRDAEYMTKFRRAFPLVADVEANEFAILQEKRKAK